MKTTTWLCATLLWAAPAFAQPADKTADLEKKIDALSQEVERLKLGGGSTARSGWADKLSLGGYGEFNAESPSRRNQKADPGLVNKTANLRRFVLMAEYRFDDRFTLRSELEMEHAGTGQGDEQRGEFEVEQAYIDWRWEDWLVARAGHLIVPMGLVNLWHEPPVFHGVERPSVEQFIIPSTWHENGAGFWGKAGIVEYQAYALSGLKAFKDGKAPSVDGFTGAGAIGGGKTEGSRSPIEDMAAVARLDLRPLPGTLIGGSAYAGKADQGLIPASITVSLWETHADFNWRGAELRGLYAQGRIGNSAALNAAVAAGGGAEVVGSRFFGGYAQAAFNILSLKSACSQYVAPFFRYERYDTQQGVKAPFRGAPANSRVEYTTGLTYKPIPKIALKVDQQWKRNQARTGVNQWDIGLGYMF